MKTLFKFALFGSTALFFFMADLSTQTSPTPHGYQLISEAHAIWGRQRRTRRRGLAVGYAAGSASGAAAGAAAASASQPQQAPAQPQYAPAQPQSTAPPQQPAAGGALPEGTVVSKLPSGCTPTDVGGVQYQHCGANYYRAAFQGNSLVYVTTKP